MKRGIVMPLRKVKAPQPGEAARAAREGGPLYVCGGSAVALVSDAKDAIASERSFMPGVVKERKC